jgi:hypothetical protein
VSIARARHQTHWVCVLEHKLFSPQTGEHLHGLASEPQGFLSSLCISFLVNVDSKNYFFTAPALDERATCI